MSASTSTSTSTAANTTTKKSKRSTLHVKDIKVLTYYNNLVLYRYYQAAAANHGVLSRFEKTRLDQALHREYNTLMSKETPVIVKARSGFRFYAEAHREETKSKHPDVAEGLQIQSIMRAQYNALSDAKKESWKKLGDQDKIRYDAEIATRNENDRHKADQELVELHAEIQQRCQEMLPQASAQGSLTATVAPAEVVAAPKAKRVRKEKAPEVPKDEGEAAAPAPKATKRKRGGDDDDKKEPVKKRASRKEKAAPAEAEDTLRTDDEGETARY